MFKIEKLNLINKNKESYTYTFSVGINYFKGENDTGKTAFYDFIDYMFGKSLELEKKEWYSNLDYAELEFIYRDNSFCIKRTMHQNENYIRYSSKSWGKAISLKEYKEKLNSIFTQDIDDLITLREFVKEDITYRTFTLFNFLGEKALGKIQDFFDKSSSIKYSIKLTSILNFLFNDNILKINSLEKEIENLKSKIKVLEKLTYSFKFNQEKINIILKKLNSKISYNGKNKEEVNKFLTEIKTLEEKTNNNKSSVISDLEATYHNLSQRIKIYENRKKDLKQFDIENENKLTLLNELNKLIENKREYSYLINPIKNTVNDISNNISFNKYYINDETINKLKEERKKIKKEIKTYDNKFSCYTMKEQAFLVTSLEEYLKEDIHDKSVEIDEIKDEIKKRKETLLILKNKDNIEKIKKLSEFITKLYLSSSKTSNITSRDENSNINIKYLKKGNILQPIIINEKENNEIEYENYYIGSNARHTLIQLCGYLGFLYLLISEKKFPVIPFLVIDHISMPFDNNNNKALGEIFKEFYKNIPKNMFQIIIFEDKLPETLSIKPDNYVNLESENKSGFNPFYYNPKIKND